MKLERLFVILLALVLVLALPVTASAEEVASGTCGENLTWVLDDEGKLTITGEGEMLFERFFFSLFIPWSDYASEIKNVVIGKGVTTIDESAFSSCDGLSSVIIPDSVTAIGAWAFGYCTSLVEITIPDSVTAIGDSAFDSCSSLTNVRLGNGVTSIGYSAFGSCTSLVEITIPDSVTAIDALAFDSCSSLTSVRLGNGVITIGYSAFDSCTSLVEITIPDSVTTIGEEAFYSCASLTSVTIGNGVTSIGDAVFDSCTSLSNIKVAPRNPNYSSDSSGVLFDKQKTALIHVPYMLSGSYIIPDSVITIGDAAFAERRNLTSVTIGNGVTTIGEEAFRWCKSLASVTIGKKVTTIGEKAFYDCKSLTSVAIPDHVTAIGDYAFAYCESLTSVAIPDSVTSIGSNAFEDCNSLTSITIPDSITTLADSVFYGCGSLTSITIPDSVTTIESYAFGCCYNLTSVTIPDSVTSMGWGVFSSCYSLTGVTIPGSINTIDSWTFEKCYSLTSVIILDGVTTIGDSAFQYCRSLTHITIPGSVTTVERCAFNGCDSLETVCYDFSSSEAGNITVWDMNFDLLYADIHWNENNDHSCDTCGTVLSKCLDKNWDAKCDICGREMTAFTDVIRLAGTNRFDTAIKVADEMKAVLGAEKFDGIILANGYNFADALAGSYLSAVKNAPILLTWNGAEKYNYLNDATIQYVKDNLKPGGTVYILGGTAAVPASIDAALAQFNVERMDGANRFETNIMILEEAGVQPGSEVLVCTSTNFADSLSASAAAKPILLVWNEGGKLFDVQKDYLSQLQNCTFTIIGGESAVSVNMTASLMSYGNVSRLAGSNRFETSVLVAEKYFADATSAVLAYAWDFPDGLCGGALAYAMKSPLILTMTKYESQAAAYAKVQGIETGAVLGGRGLISNTSVRTIFAMDVADEIIVK